MARSAELKEIIKKKTGGVFSFLSDYLLFQFLFWVELPTAGYGSRNVYKASEKATEEFLRVKGGQTKTAINNLRSKGYVQFAKGGANPEITKRGLERLRRQLPVYEEKRPWNKKMYIITYDVPEKQNAKRDRLRGTLKCLGCAMLQASVWLTPYDPRGALRGFIRRYGLGGYVIVSEVGRDGAIGGESFQTLVWKIYSLDKLDRRYKEFIEHASSAPVSEDLVLRFLAILKDDPQLPFELLPSGWSSTKAYRLHKRFVRDLGTDLTSTQLLV